MTAATNSLTAWIDDCAVGHLRFEQGADFHSSAGSEAGGNCECGAEG